MSDDKKQDLKKGFSNNLVWFLLAAFLFALMVQNFMEARSAKVSFSYQLEHLVNLQLLQPEDSRKTALNDNLVTFSGRFREHLTEEGKSRFKYLELLNENHELKNDQQNLSDDLIKEREKILQSAEWFLLLSGKEVPQEGFVVVDNFYNTQGQNNSVILRSFPRKSVSSLVDVQQKYNSLKGKPDEKGAAELGSSLIELVNQMRSPLLGIGSEQMKQTLRDIDREVTRVNATTLPLNQKMAIYNQSIGQLQGIVNELDQVEGHMRLSKLRSVRSYKDTLDQSVANNAKLEDNEAQLEKARGAVSQVIWYFNNQELSTRALEKQDPEIFHHWFVKAKAEWDQFAENKGAPFKAPDQPINTVLEKTFKSEETAPNYLSYLFTFLPILMIALVLYLVFARQMKGVGSSAMNFGKSPARLLSKDKNKITFKDVAGVDEAIEELQEIVEFLKNPQKFTALGGRIPKGVLCVGPPGTGKTLIAKAVAGEADRPFFSISGSDFVEMFVGVGASRIRDMFDQAKKHAPCIIFMDEIDAVGRHRGAGIGGGHDEREQTLNQLLVEMDGFDTNDGVILMAATNRPDVLDKALLRPGRFDRRVVINLPDIKGRFEILKVHARKIKLDPSADLFNLARSTPGSSGADLENILNEAALAAARKGRTAVTEQELSEARDKVMFGKERRSLEMDENEKRTTAYHESGHTIVGLVVEHGDTVDKVTIIPRGFSLGSTMFLPKKNRVSYWKKEIVDRLAVLMGGRCAEEIFVGDVSSGAQQDIEQATNFARSMVCEWGMSDKLGAIAYDQAGSETSQYLGISSHHEKKYSEETAKVIDEEVRRIIDEANERARQIIHQHREHVDLLAKMLIEFETLDREDIQKILDNQWSIEEKRAKLKLQDELHKLKPAAPPPPPPKEILDTKKPYTAES